MVDFETNNRKQASQLRKHYFLNQYAIIAPQRGQRPKQFRDCPHVHDQQRPDRSIVNEPALYEVDDVDGNWQVKVIANKFPALSENNPEAYGVQEVVLETPEDIQFGQLSVTDIERILQVYIQRINALRQRYNYISIFKNHGHHAGASLVSTHSQIVAMDLVPPAVLSERQALTEYQHRHQSSALCDTIRWELTQSQRVVAHTRYTTTICPYAGQFPLEAWIIPNRQTHSLSDLSDEELYSLADHLKGVSMALSSNDIDFNYHLQEGVSGEYNHFYIKVVPRLSPQAGLELNTGIHVNPVSPEYACKWYQKHVKTPDAI